MVNIIMTVYSLIMLILITAWAAGEIIINGELFPDDDEE